MKIVEEKRDRRVLRAGAGLGSGTTATFETSSAMLTVKSRGRLRSKSTENPLKEIGGAYLNTKGSGTDQESAVVILIQDGDEIPLTGLATGNRKENDLAVKAINRFLGITPLDVTAHRRVLEVEQFVNILLDHEGKDPWVLDTIMQRLVEIGTAAVPALEAALQFAGGQSREYIENTLQQIHKRG